MSEGALFNVECVLLVSAEIRVLGPTTAVGLACRAIYSDIANNIEEAPASA